MGGFHNDTGQYDYHVWLYRVYRTLVMDKECYSGRGSLVPMNRDYNQHLVNYDNTNLFIARMKK